MARADRWLGQIGGSAETTAADVDVPPRLLLTYGRAHDRGDVNAGSGSSAAAAHTGAAAPLTRVCDRLFTEAVDLGHGGADLIAVIRALEARADL